MTADILHRLTRAICAAGGSDAREAALVADHLVAANLAGHDSHGVGMLPRYVWSLGEGLIVPNRHAEVLHDRGPVLVIDGQRGYGQVIAFEAMERGIAKAGAEGAAVVALRNSSHIGRVGHWAEQCAAAGLASVHFVNVVDHHPLVALYGGAEARVGTNPFTAALPGPDGPAVLLDMATSKIAMGKARVAFNKGEPVPEDSLLDGAGMATRNPGVMFPETTGALVAMGEHKGSGLAMICELFAGALTGGRTMQPEHARHGGTINNMLSILIDPAALGAGDTVAHETQAMLAYAKQSRRQAGIDEVLMPGEPEARRRAERQANGIEVDPATWREIQEAARTIGVPADEIASWSR